MGIPQFRPWNFGLVGSAVIELGRFGRFVPSRSPRVRLALAQHRHRLVCSRAKKVSTHDPVLPRRGRYLNHAPFRYVPLCSPRSRTVLGPCQQGNRGQAGDEQKRGRRLGHGIDNFEIHQIGDEPPAEIVSRNHDPGEP